LKGSVINAGEVAGATGLVLFGLEGEGIHVDTRGWDVLVMLEGLHKIEITTLTLVEPIVAVKLKLAGADGIHTSVKNGA
jgi:hypothetical protein